MGLHALSILLAHLCWASLGLVHLQLTAQVLRNGAHPILDSPSSNSIAPAHTHVHTATTPSWAWCITSKGPCACTYPYTPTSFCARSYDAELGLVRVLVEKVVLDLVTGAKASAEVKRSLLANAVGGLGSGGGARVGIGEKVC